MFRLDQFCSEGLCARLNWQFSKANHSSYHIMLQATRQAIVAWYDPPVGFCAVLVELYYFVKAYFMLTRTQTFHTIISSICL